MQVLNINMHRRKWSMTINSRKGTSGEDDAVIQNACVHLARDHLGIPGADSIDRACRLPSPRTIRLSDHLEVMGLVDKETVVVWGAKTDIVCRLYI